MKEILFITSNQRKVLEMNEILKDYGINLIQESVLDYIEDKDKDMKEVCESASRYLAKKLNQEVVVEDTGLYFEAYNNFPGPHPKFVFNSLGFEGIMKLLEGKSRKAYFKTAVAYCKPGEDPKIFEGIMHGTISEKVYSPEKEAMPYDHIFLPDGYDRVIIDMEIKEKNSFSQRGMATRALGEYLKNKFKK